jgi:hypothetical protein
VSQRQRSLIGLAGLVGFMLAYTGCALFAWPRLAYEPVARQWAWVKVPSPLQMTFYGQILWGVIGGVAGMAAGWLLGRRGAEEAERRWLAWSVTAVVFALGFAAWHNWPR